MEKNVAYHRLFQQLSPLYGKAKNSDTIWAENLSLEVTEWRTVIAALHEYHRSLVAQRDSGTSTERHSGTDDELSCVARLIDQLATANQLGSFYVVQNARALALECERIMRANE